MSPVFKVFIATTVVGVMLYFGIDKFLGGTEKIAASLDLRSLAYLRDDSVTSKGKKDDVEALTIEAQEPAEDTPERTGESVTLDQSEFENTDDEPDTEETEEDADSEEDLESEEEEEDARAEFDEESDEDDSDERGESVELDNEFADAEETDESSGLEKAENSEDAPEEPSEDGEAEESEKVAGETEEMVDAEKSADAKESSDAEKPTEIEETPAEARARALKEKLGIKTPKPPTRAVDVMLVPSEDCDATGVALAPVSVAYRFESPTVKGASLQQLELLVAEYRRCPDSVFQLTQNSLGNEDASPTLTQMRFDELKYFFIQRSVSKTALTYPEQP